MKKQQQVKALAITAETIRKLGATQLGEAAGAGQTKNGNGITTTLPTWCLVCKF